MYTLIWHTSLNANIFATSRIKLSDFGFARMIPENSACLQTHCGSLAYAAPEIVKGKDYDGRISDIWSL